MALAEARLVLSSHRDRSRQDTTMDIPFLATKAVRENACSARSRSSTRLSKNIAFLKRGTVGHKVLSAVAGLIVMTMRRPYRMSERTN